MKKQTKVLLGVLALVVVAVVAVFAVNPAMLQGKLSNGASGVKYTVKLNESSPSGAQIPKRNDIVAIYDVCLNGGTSNPSLLPVVTGTDFGGARLRINSSGAINSTSDVYVKNGSNDGVWTNNKINSLEMTVSASDGSGRFHVNSGRCNALIISTNTDLLTYDSGGDNFFYVELLELYPETPATSASRFPVKGNTLYY